MAHFVAVADNTIRIQLPGGAVYAAALSEAASKTGARSDLGEDQVSTFISLVEASVGVLNSGGATQILLTMQVHKSSIATTVSGHDCTSPDSKLQTELETLAAGLSMMVRSKPHGSTLTISFTV